MALANADSLEAKVVDCTGSSIHEHGHSREIELYALRFECAESCVAETKTAILPDAPRVNLARLCQGEREAISTGDPLHFQSIELMKHGG